MIETVGKILVIIGILLVVVGAVLWLAGDRLSFSWIGRLPGDIRIEQPGFGCYFPITTMLLFSVILSLIVSVLSRLWR